MSTNEQAGRVAIAVPADVTNREALVVAARRVQGELGPAHVLVNNAGVMLLAPFGSDQRETTAA
jgi:NAD(P)-dependent dehydrogenase (short-subunit alcohol dehydrogenase family)